MSCNCNVMHWLYIMLPYIYYLIVNRETNRIKQISFLNRNKKEKVRGRIIKEIERRFRIKEASRGI